MKLFRKTTKRANLYVLVFGFLISTLLPMFQSSVVSANNYNQMSALARMKLQDGLKILEFCENNGARLMIPTGHGTSIDGEWKFYNAEAWKTYGQKTEANVAMLTLPAYYDDSSIDCSQLFSKFSGVFGITDADAFLNDAGFGPWADGQRIHTGACENTRATELSCLKGAIKKRVTNYADKWDDQMYYVRDKTILDAQRKGSTPGGCYAHWTSKTKPGELDVTSWTKQYNNRGDDGILGTLDSPQKIKLFDTTSNPPILVDNFVMSEGGDGNDGWQKKVNVTITTDGSNITDGSPTRCVSLANALNDSRSEKYSSWLAEWTHNHPGVSPPGDVAAIVNLTTTPTTTSCGVEGIGWIICPVMTFLGSALDSLFGFLEDNFLETDVSVIADSRVLVAWGVMRSIANIAFVIVFLIIIFSQLTGRGVTNYGVKKMLPRLVIAAILVNLSYYICLLLVDVSNVLGYSLGSVFDSIALAADPSATEPQGVAKIGGIVVAVLAGAAGVVALVLAVSGPVVIAAILALVMIVIILIGRSALIIILTIISPLAFVAYLLPNTEPWFKKWYKTFWSLLMLFPIIAVVFGASSLASKLIYDTANGNVLVQITSIGAAAIPLFFVPSLLKSSLSTTGALGAKLSGLANKAGGRVGGKVRDTSRLGEVAKNMRYKSALRRANSRSGNGAVARLGSTISGRFEDSNSRMGAVGRAVGTGLGAAGTLGARFDNSKIGKALGTDKGSVSAQTAVDTDFEKSVQESGKLLQRQYSGNNAELLRIASDTSAAEELRVAARRRLMETGSYSDKKKALMTIGARSSVREKADMNAQYFSSGMNKYFGNALGSVAFSATGTGIADEAQLQRSMIENFGQMEAETVARSGAPAMEDISKALQAATPQEQAALVHVANSIVGNKDLKPISSDSQRHFDTIIETLTSPRSPGNTP